MKKLLITGIATLGFALGTFGQGAVTLAGGGSAGLITVYGVTPDPVDGYGSTFTGFIPYGYDIHANPVGGVGLDAGFEIWYKNGVTVDASHGAGTINALDQSGQVAAAYAAMQAAGFTLATTFTGVSGVQAYVAGLSANQLNIAGAAVGYNDIAVACWAGDGAHFGTIGANDGGYHGYAGVTVFTDKFIDYTVTPALTTFDLTGDGTSVGSPAVLTGMNTSDLVLAPVPEPATFALAGLGCAALLIFRRRS